MNKKLFYSIVVLLLLILPSHANQITNNSSLSDVNVNQSSDGAPIVSIINPDNQSIVGDIVTIDVKAADSDGIAAYQILIDGVVVGNNQTYYWNTTKVSSGEHIIEAIAKDTLGNIGSTKHVVTVDTNYQSGVFKFLTYNILETGRIPQWKDVIKEENPDIMVLVETGKWVNGSTEFNSVVNELSSYFPDEHPYYAYTTKAVSSTDGEAILSRYPIINATQLGTLYHDDGTSFEPAHDFLYAVVKIGQMYVHVFGTHLKCCSGELNEISREEDIEGILNFMDTLGNVPIIFAGDFNSFSPQDVGNLAPKPGNLGDGPISMMLNNSNPRGSKIHHFYDVYRILNPYNPGYTYVDDFYRSRIDFIFVNQYFRNALVNSTVASTPSGKIGSDHYPVDAFLNLDFTTLDLRPPLPVHDLNANILNSSAVKLSWAPCVESDFDHYNIYRNNSLIAQTKTNEYNDTGLSTDTYYVYDIKPVDINDNEGVASSPIILVTNLGVMTLPEAPVVKTSVDENNYVILTWEQPEPKQFPIIEYRIYKGASKDGLYRLFAITTSTNYTDRYTFPGFTYYYYVIAVNALGESPESEIVSATIPQSTTTTTSSNQNITPTNEESTPINFSVFLLTLPLIVLLINFFKKQRKRS